MPKIIKKEEFIGKTFNKLTILEFTEPVVYTDKNGYKQKHLKVNCLCECGNKVNTSFSHVISNTATSCGCYRDALRLKHGNNKKGNTTKEYTTWQKIKDRCYNTNSPFYSDYGGRGISMCEEWKDNFSKFLEDVGKKPSNSHSIDRIDNNLGYFKENCKWSTKKEQANNRRSNKMITFNSKTQSLTEWCEELNLNYGMVKSRINKLKWSIEDSFTIPSRKQA